MQDSIDPWLLVAKRIEYLRVFPRLIVAVYLAFYIYAWKLVFRWFSHYDWSRLPETEIVGAAAVVAVAGFPTLILGHLTQVLFKLIASYWNAPTATKEATS